MRWGDVLSLLGILLVLLLVLAASYLVTRWAGQMGQGGRFSIGAPAGGGRLRVLERLAVGRDQSLLVVQSAKRYFLIGSSPSGFSLVAELTAEEGELWSSPPSSDSPAQGRPPDFAAMLRRFREKK
jgi:flagellar protein FliO/FliZ